MADGQATLSRLVLQGREEVERVYTQNVIYQLVVVKDEMLLSKNQTTLLLAKLLERNHRKGKVVWAAR